MNHRLSLTATAATLALTLGLVGCAPTLPGAPEKAALSIPTQWVHEKNAPEGQAPSPHSGHSPSESAPPQAIETTWWQQLGDAQLNALVVQALTHNANIGMAVAQVDAARAQLEQANAAARPALNFGVAAQASRAVQYWRTLHSDAGAEFDKVVTLDATQIVPQVTWGTSPEMVLGVDGTVPDPDKEKDSVKRNAMERALTYMNLEPGKPLNDIYVDKVFIGSCTNSRIEDMREAAAIVKQLGQKVAKNIKLAMVVPGSGIVKEQAEREGLDVIFKAAGFEWREPGCSMCLAMNADRLEPGERCASTSNRNFEGRQGAGGRTHLVSPAMAAAAAVHGHFVDVRRFT